MKKTVVAVALSGGVDSLVSGFLLKQQYKNVFGIHFTTGYEKAPVDMSRIETQLGFPVTTIDLSEIFERKVIRYFINTYLEGKTPNPCLICNREIKFGALLEHSRKMGADLLATGHYANIMNTSAADGSIASGSFLEKGKDVLKDQSYFLSMLTGEQLSQILFPLSGLNKKKVKAIAESEGLAPLHPSESQDICFIHDNNFSRFILDKTKIKPGHGDIVDMEGKTVGRHNGLHRFTIGQRKGINCPASEPYYVKQIDMKNNILRVCFKKDLTCKSFTVSHINWNFSSPPPIPDMSVKIRYSHPGASATLSIVENCGTVVFDTPQKAVTPGQAAVFYKDERVLGAGIIQ